MKDIIIHHPNGDFTLEQLQNDVDAARRNHLPDTWIFTSITVQALIDKIKELSDEQ